MSKELHKNIFSENECLSEELLLAYANNNLNTTQRFSVEKHLIDCELCSDALEGFTLLKNNTILEETKQLVKKTYPVIEKNETRVIYFEYRKPLAIAASILLLIGAGFVYTYYFNETDKQLAQTITTPALQEAEKTVSPLNEELDKEQLNTKDLHQSPVADTQMPIEQEERQNAPTSVDTRLSILKDRAKEKSNESVVAADESISIRLEEVNYAPIQSNDNTISLDLSKTKGGESVNGATSDSDQSERVTTGSFGSESQKKEVEELNKTGNLSTIINSSTTQSSSAGNEEKRKSAKPQVDTKTREDESKKSDEVAKKSKAIQFESASDSEKSPSGAGAVPSSNQKEDDGLLNQSSTPEYKGGDLMMKKFIQENMNLTDCKSCSGTVTLTFTVKADGNLKNIQPKTEIKNCKCLTDEAVRITKKMPAWIPAKQNGKVVDFSYTLPMELKK